MTSGASILAGQLCAMGGKPPAYEGVTMRFALRWARHVLGYWRLAPGLTRRHPNLVLVSATAAGLCAALLTAGVVPAAAGVRSAASGGSWGRAIEVPGVAALNGDGFGSILAMSCPSAGNCTAGGYFRSHPGHDQAMVVSERNGTWGRAKEVPGIAVVDKGPSAWAELTSVSCASAGNCAAGGSYLSERQPHHRAWVVSENHGKWGKAEQVPGIASLNKGRYAATNSVSCGSAGNCAAGGGYTDGSGSGQAFLVVQRHGRWRKAEQVPGTAPLATGDAAGVSSVSCASADNCSAVGGYGQYGHRAFVIAERDGRWGHAETIPGTTALATGGTALAGSVSCASAGNCAAVGWYKISSGQFQKFVASEKHGRWGNAVEVPGMAALNTGGYPTLGFFLVSCRAAGNCSAGGSYVDALGHWQAFVVSQRNGIWSNAQEVPGTAALNTRGAAYATSVSCGSAGNCAAGGGYEDGFGQSQGFVVSEKNGRWGKAQKVPGLARLNKGGAAAVWALSCASAGKCSAWRVLHGPPQPLPVRRQRALDE